MKIGKKHLLKGSLGLASIFLLVSIIIFFLFSNSVVPQALDPAYEYVYPVLNQNFTSNADGWVYGEASDENNWASGAWSSTGGNLDAGCYDLKVVDNSATILDTQIDRWINYSFSVSSIPQSAKVYACYKTVTSGVGESTTSSIRLIHPNGTEFVLYTGPAVNQSQTAFDCQTIDATAYFDSTGTYTLKLFSTGNTGDAKSDRPTIDTYWDDAGVQLAYPSIPPQWSNQSQSTNIPGVGAKVNLSAYWTDNVALSYAWLATNETGSWENKTSIYLISFGGAASGWSNFTWQNSSISAGTVIAWKIYANDSSGNENVTNVMTFEVKPTYLLVNLTFPSPLTYTETNPYLVSQNSTFWINATVKCYSEGVGGSCGSVLGLPRYNQSGTVPNQIISTIEGDTPFWYLKILNKTLNGSNYIINGGFETGNAYGWIIQPGLQTPSVVSVPHEGRYAICAPRSDSTTSTANALYWSIVQNSTSGFQPVVVTDDLYLSLFVYGDYRLCPTCANYPGEAFAEFSYTNVTLGFSDGTTKIIASTLGRWYVSVNTYLGGNPAGSTGGNTSRRLTARIKDFKPVGSKIVNITIEVRKGPDTYTRYYPGVCIDSVQLFNGTILLNNYENKIFALSRRAPYGYQKAENLVDYASIYQGATVIVSSSVPPSQDYYDLALPKWAIDDSAFNESEVYHTQLRWKSDNEGAGAWLNVSFPSKVVISKVELWDYRVAQSATYNYAENITAGHLEFEDGSSISFGALPPSGENPLVITFEPKNTSWVRIVIDGTEGAASLPEADVYAFSPSNKIYVHTLIFPEENKTTYIEKGLSSYFEIYDISRSFLLHNQSFSNIMGGDVYEVIGMPACGYLEQGQSCNVSWLINATGNINSIWIIDVNFTSSIETIPKNDTDDSYVKITSAGVDTQPPTYSLNSTNSTLAGTAVSHNLYWQDNFGLSYAIFSFDNCTGTLQNITGMSLSGNSAWSNFTVVTNSTVGCTIRWCVYANDTSNNWNGSSCLQPFSYLTTSAVYVEIIPSQALTNGILFGIVYPNQIVGALNNTEPAGETKYNITVGPSSTTNIDFYHKISATLCTGCTVNSSSSKTSGSASFSTNTTITTTWTIMGNTTLNCTNLAIGSNCWLRYYLQTPSVLTSGNYQVTYYFCGVYTGGSPSLCG